MQKKLKLNAADLWVDPFVPLPGGPGDQIMSDTGDELAATAYTKCETGSPHCNQCAG